MESKIGDDLKKIRDLINTSQFVKAQEKIRSFQLKEDLSPGNKDELLLLKAQLANKNGQFQESLRILKDISEDFQFSPSDKQYLELLTLLGDNHFKLGRYDEALGFIDEGFDLLNSNPKIDKEVKDWIFPELISIKVGILRQTGHISKALNILNENFDSFDNLAPHHLIQMTKIKGVLNGMIGNFQECLHYLRKALDYSTKYQETGQIASIYNNLAMAYSQIGKFSEALEISEKSLDYEVKTGNIHNQAQVLDSIGKIYYQIGQYEKAKEYFLRSVALAKKQANPYHMSILLFHLIENYLELDQVDECQKYITEFEMLCMIDDNPAIFQRYQIIQALIWKRSPQLRYQFQAHEILQSIAFGPVINHEINLSALLNLADLLYDEMRVTMKPEIMDDLAPVVEELERLAKTQHLILLSAQIYLIKARFAMLALELDRARYFLTKAQNIAMHNQLDRIAAQIAAEHDKLLEKQALLKQIDKKKLSKAVLQDILGFNLDFPKLIKKQLQTIPLPERETPIFFSILNECGPLIFSQQFNPHIVVNDQLFGGLLSAFYSYCVEMTEQSFDRAKFGKYTIMLIPKTPLIFAYIYIGSSYSARKRLDTLINKLEQNEKLWQQIRNSVNSHNIMSKYTLQQFLIHFHHSFPEVVQQKT